MTIPKLERHCKSWIVVSRSTGLIILETYSRWTVLAINQTNYEIFTAYQWLCRFNENIKNGINK
jgi:hypothetical protein